MVLFVPRAVSLGSVLHNCNKLLWSLGYKIEHSIRPITVVRLERFYDLGSLSELKYIAFSAGSPWAYTIIPQVISRIEARPSEQRFKVKLSPSHADTTLPTWYFSELLQSMSKSAALDP